MCFNITITIFRLFINRAVLIWTFTDLLHGDNSFSTIYTRVWRGGNCSMLSDAYISSALAQIQEALTKIKSWKKKFTEVNTCNQYFNMNIYFWGHSSWQKVKNRAWWNSLLRDLDKDLHNALRHPLLQPWNIGLSKK